jgi:thiol-disulfide isomerase/thioredoxin
MQHAYRLATALALVCLGATVVAQGAKGPFQSLSYEQALAEAAKQNKWVMIDFYTTWCPPCKKLDEITWRDPKVIDWLTSNTIALKIDAEAEEAIARKHGIDAYPTMVLIDPTGRQRGSIIGFVPPEAFLAEAGAYLAGKDDVAIAREKLEGEGEDNPMARQEFAGRLARAEKHEEALENFLWCYDHGLEHDPSYVGVRSSFLLGEIATLGESYPPALDALRTRRDAGERILLQHLDPVKYGDPPAPARTPQPSLTDILHAVVSPGGNDPRRAYNEALAFHELAAMNHYVGDPARTMTLFETIRADYPQSPLLPMAVTMLFEDLAKAHRYAEIDGAMDLVREAEQAIGEDGRVVAFLKMQSGADEASAAQMNEMLAYHRARLSQQVAMFYEVLLGVGRAEDAERVAQRMLELDASEATYNNLAWGAFLCGKANEKGLEHAQKAMALSRGMEAAVVDTYVRLLAQAGKTEEAGQAIEEARSRIGDPEGLQLLKDLEEQLKAGKAAEPPARRGA